MAAYWISNSTDENNDYIVQAVKTACDLIEEARTIDKTMSTRFPGKHFRIGCGVHLGEAVLGNIGLDSRRDSTMLGDAVNVTFGIEALCSLLGKEILVSDDIKKQSKTLSPLRTWSHMILRESPNRFEFIHWNNNQDVANLFE